MGLHSPDFGRDLESTATGINAKCLKEMGVCVMICLVCSEDGCSVYCRNVGTHLPCYSTVE